MDRAVEAEAEAEVEDLVQALPPITLTGEKVRMEAAGAHMDLQVQQAAPVMVLSSSPGNGGTHA